MDIPPIFRYFKLLNWKCGIVSWLAEDQDLCAPLVSARFRHAILAAFFQNMRPYSLPLHLHPSGHALVHHVFCGFMSRSVMMQEKFPLQVAAEIALASSFAPRAPSASLVI